MEYKTKCLLAAEPKLLIEIWQPGSNIQQVNDLFIYNNLIYQPIIAWQP